MLFNSYFFIFCFLPVTLAVFFVIGARGHHRIAISWLVAASLFFYGWWNPSYLGLILASVLFNYSVGVALGEPGAGHTRKLLLIFGVTANLCLIGYFKYTNFFIDTFNTVLRTEYNLKTIILPLAISFFTFQQIAYLVDAYRKKTREYNFLHYCLFITFFPQLIAGPIVHHKDMLPQFNRKAIYRFNYRYLSIGITIFIFGLCKKVVLADNIAPVATLVFDASKNNVPLTMFEAWTGALAYTFQLYFDFSGYSDMAVGVAHMIGIRLPLNFNSPYQAVNTIDFWRRWHITLSNFLRDYIYIPLGGSRMGNVRRYVNLMITMLLGGLWHGAGWTFVVWGALHGFFLIVNHAWHNIRRSMGQNLKRSTRFGRAAGRLLTFFSITCAWVFFRAENFDSAVRLLKSMAGVNSRALPVRLNEFVAGVNMWLSAKGVHLEGLLSNGAAATLEDNVQFTVVQLFFLVTLFIIAWFMPNTIDLMKACNPVISSSAKTTPLFALKFRFSMPWAVTVGLLFSVAILSLGQATEFLYFQF